MLSELVPLPGGVPQGALSEKQAQKEIEESVILSLYLEAHNINMNDVDNFTKVMVSKAKRWHKHNHPTRK